MRSQYYQDPVTTLYKGDIRQVVKELPPVDMIMTSPPYYSMRKYSGDDLIFDGKEGCEHRWALVSKETGRKHWNQGGKVIPNSERIIQMGDLFRLVSVLSVVRGAGS